MLPFMTQPAVAPACFRPDYKIAQSQVFKGAQHLARAITMTGNRQTFAFRALVTRDAPGTAQTLYNVDHFPHGPCSHFLIDTDDRLWVRHTDGDGNVYDIKTLAVFRSPGVYDVLIIVNTAAETPSDSLQTWVNGIRITAFTSANYPNPNWGGGLPNYAGGVDLLGVYRSGGSYYYYAKGAFADVVWLDGTIPAVTDFGSFNIHGVWVPKRPAFTLAQYGVNGWFLDFSDPLNPGKDVSGRGNHFTAVGFDAAGNDTVVSTPTNVYATLNALVLPRYNNERYQLTDGNCRATSTTGGYPAAVSTMVVRTGRWYDETTVEALSGPNDGLWIGLYGEADIAAGYPSAIGNTATSVAYMPGGSKKSADNPTTFGAAWGAGAIIGRAIDCETGGVWFSKDGVWQGGGDPATGVNPAFAFTPGQLVTAGWTDPSNAGNATFSVNFGQRAFAYAPPTGFKALCTDNLPEPDIKDPAEAFTQATATGANMVAMLHAGSAHWNGQWVEIVKRRDAPEDWRLRFSDDPANAWATNTADAKAAAPALAEGGDYVGYRLRVGKRYGVWTAEVAHVTGTATTVTHNLATVRNAVIATRVGAGGGDRYFRHPDMTAGHLMIVNSMAGSTVDGTLTAFSADDFQIASTAPSGSYRVLVLAERPGLLTLTTYVGNGLADGAFGTAGILPLWLWMFKSTNNGGRRMWDAARSPANPASTFSAFNAPDAEGTLYPLDLVVGGVKARTPDNAVNGSGDKYHLVMWGRPVGGVCVAPATAR